jgi:hypothetical protein
MAALRITALNLLRLSGFGLHQGLPPPMHNIKEQLAMVRRQQEPNPSLRH